MKTIKELNLGFRDAQSYSQKDYKNMFNEVFVRNHFLEELLDSTKYFLIGEKGTGKTAYATFLRNNDYKNTVSFLKFLSTTDYEKFYTLKKQKNLDLSEYNSIWKIILMLLLSKSISENPKIIAPFNRGNIKNLIDAIDEYYMRAFSPEITTALKIIDESSVIAQLICEYIQLGGEKKSKYEFTETRFQTNLLYIERQFRDAIAKLKLTKNVILFIDGIDVRPTAMPYDDYIDCIRGLAYAAWELNTELFHNVKDSQGYCRIVLLLRPDIFNSLNLQNSSTKIMDNSVMLNWRTTYRDYKFSPLYKVATQMLSYEQSSVMGDDIWESYFPWKIPTTSKDRDYDTAFMTFLRISLSRPRDILTILHLIKQKMA